MSLSKVEKAIRANFPGENNKGLRKEVREAAEIGAGSVRSVAGYIGLTACGKAGLEAVAKAVEQDK